LADNNNIKSQNNDDKNRHVSSVKIPAKIRQDAKKDIKRMMQERESRLRKYNLLLLKKQQLLNELLKLRERAKIEESLANQELLKKQIQEFEMKLKVLEDQINEEKVYVEDKNDNGLSSELETEKNVEQKQQEINNSENESAKQNTNENTTLSAKDRFDILLKNINENNKSNSQQDSEELPKSNLNPASNIEQTVVDSKLTSQVSEDNIVNQQKMEVSEQHIKEERPYNDLRPNNDLVNNKSESTEDSIDVSNVIKKDSKEHSLVDETLKAEEHSLVDETLKAEEHSLVDKTLKADESGLKVNENQQETNVLKNEEKTSQPESVTIKTEQAINAEQLNQSNTSANENSSVSEIKKTSKHKPTITKNGEYLPPELSLPDNLTDEEIEMFMQQEQNAKELAKIEEEEEDYEGLTPAEIEDLKARRAKFKALQEKYNNREMNLDGERGDYRKNLDFTLNTGLKYFKVKPPKKPFIIAGITILFALIAGILITYFISNRPAAPVVLKKISISQSTVYQYVGEKLDLRGLYLTCEYSDGTKKEVEIDSTMISRTSSNISASPSLLISSTADDTYVYFIYGKKEVKLDVSLVNISISDVSSTLYSGEIVEGDFIKFEDILILANSNVGQIRLSTENSDILIHDNYLSKTPEGFYLPKLDVGKQTIVIRSYYNTKVYQSNLVIYVTKLDAILRSTEVTAGDKINYSSFSLYATQYSQEDDHVDEQHIDLDLTLATYKINGVELEKVSDGVIIPEDISGEKTITIEFMYNGKLYTKTVSLNVLEKVAQPNN